MDSVEHPVAAHLSAEHRPVTMEKNVLVEGDYGQGAYAPTIRLTARQPEGIDLLRSVFDALGQAEPGETRQLNDEPGVELGAAIYALRLRVTATTPQPHLVRDGSGGFEWSCTAEEWRTASDLLEPLTRQRGHQYLTSEVEDHALVEVSAGELPP